MKCDVLKDVSFAIDADGLKAASAKAGDKGVEIPDHLVPGLEAEGYVRAAFALSAPRDPLDHDGDGRNLPKAPRKKGGQRE
jgi:hypothetical protein